MIFIHVFLCQVMQTLHWTHTYKNIYKYIKSYFEPKLTLIAEFSLNCISFLNANIYIKNNLFSFSHFEKNYNSYEYTNFYSNIPLYMKKSIIKGLIYNYIIVSSTLDLFKIIRNKFYQRLIARNYHPALIRTTKKADYKNRSEMLQKHTLTICSKLCITYITQKTLQKTKSNVKIFWV